MAETILQRIAGGQSGAIRECLDRYGDFVWSLAHRYLSAMGEDVDDAVQEIFIELWRSAPRFDPAIGSEPAFIATIAHRRLISRQRRAGRRRTVPVESIAEPAARAQLRDPAQLRDEARSAAEAFRRLSDEERHIIELSLYHGLTHERIAAHINIPVGTVKTRIRRGLIRLREFMSEPAAGEAHPLRPTAGGPR
ncbi:MAG: sigma-70 family RNA polymerase sigma factor [Phycisphaerales bacterium]|nr:sigma-70 family RNA polymerase sigma factor [Phycisphaerales bacterium]